MYKKYEMELGGRTLSLEFGKYAEQTNGSTFVHYGDTVVMAVSYTHLDVYKRQSERSAPIRKHMGIHRHP